jgi:hypothetical protein
VKKLERERAATAFAELSESSEEGQSQRVYAYSPAGDTALGQSTQLDDDAILAYGIIGEVNLVMHSHTVRQQPQVENR